MSDFVEMLVEMGFPRNRAEKSVAATGNQGVQPAMEWLLSHQDDPDIDDPQQSSTSHVLGTASDVKQDEPPPQEVKSLKCEDCGKLLRSDIEIQSHAARTGHSNFAESTEEIKPLTEEEKKLRAKQLEERLAAKKAERQEMEKKAAVEREKVRRKTGKELSSIRHEMEMKEAKKIAEQKRREKMEEKLARQKVKDQIAQDRADKAAKLQAEKQQQQQQQQPQQQQQVQPLQTQPGAKKEYDSCRLQIRCHGGQVLTQTFKPFDTLIDVNKYILMNRSGDNLQPFVLMTNFPKKTFSPDDMGKTLQELGLVPSAVLIMSQQSM